MDASTATARSPDGLLLRYAVAGSGQPLVLLHPFSDALDAWWDIGLAGRLARTCRVIAIDARGHGGSDKPRESARHRLEHQVIDVLTVLDAAEVERAHVVGYSMGGWTALGLASVAPSRLRSLVRLTLCTVHIFAGARARTAASVAHRCDCGLCASTTA